MRAFFAGGEQAKGLFNEPADFFELRRGGLLGCRIGRLVLRLRRSAVAALVDGGGGATDCPLANFGDDAEAGGGIDG